MIKQQSANLKTIQKFSDKFKVQIDSITNISKQLDKQKQFLSEIDAKVDAISKKIQGRSADELVEDLMERANKDASEFLETIFVPEMGVHPIEGKQEKTEL